MTLLKHIRDREYDKFEENSFDQGTDVRVSVKDSTIVSVEFPPNQSGVTIANVSAPVSTTTEYNYVIPTNSRVIYFKPRKDAVVRFSFISGQSITGPYISVPSGQAFVIDDMRSLTDLTLYFNTDKANNVLEILVRS